MQVQEAEVLKLRSEMSVYVRQKGSVAALAAIDLSDDIGDEYAETHSNKPLFRSQYFMNTMVFYGLVQEAAVYSYYVPLKKEIEEIIRLIEEEIKKHP